MNILNFIQCAHTAATLRIIFRLMLSRKNRPTNERTWVLRADCAMSSNKLYWVRAMRVHWHSVCRARVSIVSMVHIYAYILVCLSLRSLWRDTAAKRTQTASEARVKCKERITYMLVYVERGSERARWSSNIEAVQSNHTTSYFILWPIRILLVLLCIFLSFSFSFS